MDKKIEELLNAAKLNSLIHPLKNEEAKKDNPYVVALVIVGAIALIAAIAYAVYYFFVPDRLVDFEDDFDDENAEDDEDADTVQASADREELKDLGYEE